MEQADASLFKKKLKKMAQFKGHGTELISLYIPPDADRSSVMGQITEEMSQSSNIKSPTTRKNVQGALKRISNFLKQINFRIPENGLVVFCGNVSEVEGKSDIKLFTLRPPTTLKTKLYWCDSEFHLAPLEEMAKPKEVFALIAIDKREATIALLKGKKYEVIAKFTSNVPGKTRAGGQSAHRFERLREEAAQEFFKRVGEKINAIFVEWGDKLSGIILGGPGATKNYFLNKEVLDHRLKKKFIGTLDTSYTDESGIREMFMKSGDLLKNTEVMQEKKLIDEFFQEAVKGGLAAYGEKEVNEALELGKARLLILSEGIEWIVFKTKCTACGNVEETVVKEPKAFNPNSVKCRKCDSVVELIEETDYLDHLLEKAQKTGAETRVVSVETDEGMQFLKSFGGIGALLRYK